MKAKGSKIESSLKTKRSEVRQLISFTKPTNIVYHQLDVEVLQLYPQVFVRGR